MLLLLWLLSLSGTNAQFAEIASLATSFLGPALSGGGLGGLAGLAGTAGQAGAAAGGAAGALGQIGQLYQLAQGALQLTSTGVGVLNQASEGNWFPAALETAAKNQEQLRKNGGGMGLPGLGGLGGGGGGGLHGLMPLGPLGPLGGKSSGGSSVGPEFGTNFPAPNIEDYNEEIDITTTTKKPKSPFESVEIEDKDLQSPSPTAPTTTTTTEISTEPVTLFPEEEETYPPSTEKPRKQIRIELPKEEEDYIDQITKEGATRVEVTNREKKDEDENLFLAAPTIPRALPVVTSHSATVPKGEKVVMVPNLDKLVNALREKSRLSEEEIMEIVGQVETNSNVDKPPKIDFGSGVQNINEKKADNRKRILEASRRIDDHLRGQSHRKLSKVTLAPTAAPTPAPFVHSTQPPTPPPPPPPQPSQEILNNRLQREIVAAGAAAAGDKDLLSSRPVLQKATPAPIARFVYPAPQQQHLLQPQTQAQVYQQPQLLSPQPQRVQGVYQNQIPNSFPIQQQQPQTQQQQIQQYYQQYQQYYQQYYPQYYQQQLQQQYGQLHHQPQPTQQQYGQLNQQQPATQQPQAQQMYHTQQQVLLTGTTQPRVQPPQQVQQVQHVQQQQQPPIQQQRVHGDVPQQKPVQVSGQSSRIYTNQPSGAAFFVATKDTPIVRRQRQPHARVQAVKTVRRSTPQPPGAPFQPQQQLQQQRRFFSRTAQPIALTTPSPVRGDARVAGRSNPANL